MALNAVKRRSGFSDLALIDVIANMERFKAMPLDKLAVNINKCYSHASVTARKLAIEDVVREATLLYLEQCKEIDDDKRDCSS